jgi:hypothetical protein
MKSVGSLLCASLAVLLICPVASAHHSRAAFDLDHKVEMQATITRVRWTNPHVFLVGNVKTPDGRTQEWVFEGHSISGLVRQGWTRDSEAGTNLTLVVNQHHDPVSTSR